MINILHYTDLDKLEKWLDPDTSLRLKIKDLSTPGDSNSTKIDDALDRLISTKKILLLFETRNTPIKPDSENNTTHYSLWEACCLFKEFANNSFTPEFPYLKELEEDSENNRKVLYDYQNAVIHLDWFIKAIQQLEKQSYSPTIFLKSGKNKQKQVHQLINNLKNIPITQVDTDSINNTFEQWKKEHQLLIDEPRYRLLTKLCMLIYRQFMKLFYPASASDCSTASHQTINKLQEKFLEANLHLQKLREHFTSSVQNETATRLTFAVR